MRLVVLWLGASLIPFAAAAHATERGGADAEPPRLALAGTPRIEPAPQRSGRYTMTARFAREESAGELREGERFVLIGRLAKGNASCDFSALFADGFED